VPTMPQPEPSIRSHAYVFSVGDTLASVAVRYGVSIADLRAANPDMDLRRLKAGDAIRVPATLSR
jgi:LysM repeat protein